MDNLTEVKKILSKALFVPAENISADDVLLEMKGMDSLAFETIVVEIEDATGREIDVARAVSVETVADLAKIIENLRTP